MNPVLENNFLAIFKDNKEVLFRICSSYATDHQQAEDIFQEVLLNIWQALPGFRNEAVVTTWVYRIALNVCLRARHNADKNQKRFVKLESVQLQNIEATMTTDTDNTAFAELYTCIKKLDDTDKSLILLFLEDLPYKEIAAITGITENYVAVKIKRIKNKLFTCLKS